ncbi:unnamed protein product [Hyaloperonospora brassicae]|uniref:Protein kinase domain-containing protein n=1 Tax=Hyaloperonospora brassicae TaxID=162125 RepID=A0AAV0TKP0_HYABA|nr:unnamed protein product [Hyaloperonospora brassicae]
MSDASSCRLPRDLGIFDFFRSRSLSLGRRESHRPTSRAPVREPKPARHSIAASSSMPPPRAPAAELLDVSQTAAASCSAFVPPLSEIAHATATSVDSLSTNDHLSDDDSDSDSDTGTASTGDCNSESSCSSSALGSAIRDGEELVALKVFKTSLLKKMRDVKRVGRRMVVSTALDKVQMEIAIMKKLHHPNLLNLLEVFDDDAETLVLMLEYAPSGQVMQWYPDEKVYKKTGGQREAACFREDELRPENILVGQDGTYKISGLWRRALFRGRRPSSQAHSLLVGEASVAASKPHRKGYVSTTAGTYAFMGPETLKGGEYSAYAADIWALGVTVHALALGAIPFYDPDVARRSSR